MAGDPKRKPLTLEQVKGKLNREWIARGRKPKPRPKPTKERR